MEFSTLNNAFRFSFNFDLEGCVEAIAEAASNTAFNATKAVLDRAIADTRKVINTGRATRQVADAVVQSTAVRADVSFNNNILSPAHRVKTAIVSPILNTWETSLDLITDYLESTPVKVAPALESLPISKDFDFEASLATVREEIEAQSEIGAPLIEEKPQVINGALVSSAGVTSLDNGAEDQPQAIAVTEAVKKEPKTSSRLSELIREEVAKQ